MKSKSLNNPIRSNQSTVMATKQSTRLPRQKWRVKVESTPKPASYKDALKTTPDPPKPAPSKPATKIGNCDSKKQQPILSPYKDALAGTLQQNSEIKSETVEIKSETIESPHIDSTHVESSHNDSTHIESTHIEPPPMLFTDSFKTMLNFVCPGAQIKIHCDTKFGEAVCKTRVRSVDYTQYHQRPAIRIKLESSDDFFYVTDLNGSNEIVPFSEFQYWDSKYTPISTNRVRHVSLPILEIRGVFEVFEKSDIYKFDQFMEFTRDPITFRPKKYHSEQEFKNDFNQRVKDFEFLLTDNKEKYIMKKFVNLKTSRQCDCREKIRTVEDFERALRNGPSTSFKMIDENDNHCCSPQSLLRVILNAVRDDLPLHEINGALYGFSLPRNCPHIFCIDPHFVSMYNPGAPSKDFSGGGKLKHPLARILFWQMLIAIKPEYEDLFNKHFCLPLIDDCRVKGYVEDSCSCIYEVIEQFKVDDIDIEEDELFLVLFGILRNGIEGDLNRGTSFIMYNGKKVSTSIRESDIDVWIDHDDEPRELVDYGCWIRSTIKSFACALYPRLN